jgi:hypothetical protein
VLCQIARLSDQLSPSIQEANRSFRISKNNQRARGGFEEQCEFQKGHVRSSVVAPRQSWPLIWGPSLSVAGFNRSSSQRHDDDWFGHCGTGSSGARAIESSPAGCWRTRVGGTGTEKVVRSMALVPEVEAADLKSVPTYPGDLSGDVTF